jgi:hypothetical protein
MEFFTMYFEVQIPVIYSNHEYDVTMNGSVNLLKLKIGIINICISNANLLL